MRKKAQGREIEAPDRGELLRSVPMFASLDDEEIVLLSRIGRWRRHERGETLFEEGARGSEMFVVARGKIVLQKSSLDGLRFVAERGKGEVLGEMALFDDRRRSATALCQTDCLLLTLSQTEFIACVRKNPSVALGVITNLIDRLREADARATLATSLGVEGRIAYELLERCRLVDGRQFVRPKPSAVALAERVGSTRETVSRMLTKLQTKGFIARDKDLIEILDEVGLQNLTGE